MKYGKWFQLELPSKYVPKFLAMKNRTANAILNSLGCVVGTPDNEN